MYVPLKRMYIRKTHKYKHIVNMYVPSLETHPYSFMPTQAEVR